VADFYNKTRDPANTDFLTTVLQPQFATHSDPTGTPDFLHLGRAGAEAEAETWTLPSSRRRTRTTTERATSASNVLVPEAPANARARCRLRRPISRER
jgi:hypothetical protein